MTTTPPSPSTLKANAERAILQIESGKTLALMAVDPVAIIRAYIEALERVLQLPPMGNLSELKDDAEDVINNYLGELSSKRIRAYLDALERENARLDEGMDDAEDWTFLRDENRRLRERIAELERECQEPCPTCKGRGGFDVVEDLLMCAACKGTGKVLSQPTLTFSDLHYREVTDGVPNDVIAAARLVHEWMASNGYKDWALMDIQARQSLTFSDALRIARGCLYDYEVMDEIGLVHVGGIQTVINALEAAEKEHK